MQQRNQDDYDMDEDDGENQVLIGNTKVRINVKAQQVETDFLVNTDPECLRFKQESADMLLVDKVIHREVRIIDLQQRNGFVELHEEDEEENDEDGGED